jgi:hypothetical protein
LGQIYEHLERFGLGLFAAQARAAREGGRSSSSSSSKSEGDGGGERRRLKVDADEERPARSAEEMAREAAWLAEAFAKQ